MNVIGIGHGKWQKSNVPRKGWHCIGIEELDEPTEVCEMCETQDIRYVHVMAHSCYPGLLRCGCICAGHMEEDLQNARTRENRAKQRTSRRERWLTRKGWHKTDKGNFTIRTRGYRVTVYAKEDQWSAWILRECDDARSWCPHSYATAKVAALAAYDTLQTILDRDKPLFSTHR